jgi:hypothetical protein
MDFKLDDVVIVSANSNVYPNRVGFFRSIKGDKIVLSTHPDGPKELVKTYRNVSLFEVDMDYAVKQ